MQHFGVCGNARESIAVSLLGWGSVLAIAILLIELFCQRHCVRIAANALVEAVGVYHARLVRLGIFTPPAAHRWVGRCCIYGCRGRFAVTRV